MNKRPNAVEAHVEGTFRSQAAKWRSTFKVFSEARLLGEFTADGNAYRRSLQNLVEDFALKYDFVNWPSFAIYVWMTKHLGGGIFSNADCRGEIEDGLEYHMHLKMPANWTKESPTFFRFSTPKHVSAHLHYTTNVHTEREFTVVHFKIHLPPNQRFSAPVTPMEERNEACAEFLAKMAISREEKREETTKTLTIVLLGETGVGKSTFINGIPNYLAFNSLAEAQKNEELNFFIPARFAYDGKTIFIGEDDVNEQLESTGESATQRPKVYEFLHEEQLFRVIDVPGVGDSRGADQDRRNFDYILEEINKHAKINAFCIVLPSDGARITVAMRYCLNELLANLHKDAARNIVFCFTKARATFYQSGDTLPLLDRYLETLRTKQGVDIPLDEGKNTFYFDNEAFKYLCLRKNGVDFQAERKEYEKSFSVSKASTERLLAYVRTLAPHDTTAMAALTEARRLILHMVPISAETSKKIRMNANALEAEIEKLKLSRRQGKSLEEFLVYTEYFLETTALERSRTVCASSKCIQKIPIPDSSQFNIVYTVCHDHCALRSTTPGCYPDPALKSCKVFPSRNLKCTNCGCSWEMHLRISHLQTLTCRKVENTQLQAALKHKDIEHLSLSDVIGSYKSRLQGLREDEARIKRMCAKFSTFLRNNSLSIRNDVYADFLKQAVRLAEEEVAVGGSRQRAEELRASLHAYEEEVRILQTAENADCVVTIADVFRLKDDLEELKSRHSEIGAFLSLAERKFEDSPRTRTPRASAENAQTRTPLRIKISGSAATADIEERVEPAIKSYNKDSWRRITTKR